jgi:oligoendopeptidase F
MKMSRVVGFAVAFALTGGAASAATESSQPSAKWDLTDLYATPAAWQESYEHVKAAALALDQFHGTLATDAKTMFVALDAISNLRKELYRLETYAHLLGDEDVGIAVNQERQQQGTAIDTLFQEHTAWLAPEILSVGEAKTAAFRKDYPELERRFGLFLSDTLRGAPHTLDSQGEALLAAAGNVLQQPSNSYAQISDNELPYPSLTLSSGEPFKLSQPLFEKYRQVSNRADRKKVFDAYFGAWKEFEGTIGSLLTQSVMGDTFIARSRKFKGVLESALFANNMPETVYRTLIAETNAGLPTLHRYLKLRQRLLGITGPLEYYDMYAPMFPTESPRKFDLAESERLTLEALRPLGKDYLDLLRRGFAAKWMNAYPAKGKATGAYMSGSAYDVHPFLLLNHNDDFKSVSTLAHEWGHAVHTLLADKAQPWETSEYATFIAESASIGNEMLLSDYLNANAKGPREKLFYLGEALESIRTTFFRQAMFAEFEYAIHDEYEQGRPLSGARMSELYCKVVRKYYGEAEGVTKIDPAYCTEWEYISHFYSRFYVYQYATSMAGAASMTAAITKGGAAARERYLALLSAGGSDYPYELYKKAGIDMASPEPYRALLQRMNKIMDQIEQLKGPSAKKGG